MNSNNYRTAKYASYISNISMAAASVLSPLLFVTFREMYEISYTLLGLLVVINFSVQLAVDLIFSFFGRLFNIHKTIRFIPFIAFVGFLIYALMPTFFPGAAYLWIALGTVVISVAAGLGEVLTSPLIAAIPSDNPEREMSKLHSIYAWGVVGVVLISTLTLRLIGTHNWMILALILSVMPLVSFVMFATAKLPPMSVDSKNETGKRSEKKAGFIMCIAFIFLGGASECTMTQWVSSFAENAIGIPKIWGDIFGMAAFALLLGTGRTLYAKYGKSIGKIMLFGMLGAAVCYIISSFALNSAIALIGCVLTGFFTSMLWPGTIIYAEENYPGLGVAAYALLAAGGDCGASIAPQLVGLIADSVGVSSFALEASEKLGITAEQIGMRAGIGISALFPILGVILALTMRRYFARNKRE
ncbi:MAG: hypothetical protein E7671_00300 [Ruminococcaceae bacterium]|nr:hypothetical protein [Oscillospiraceae bacterium]